MPRGAIAAQQSSGPQYQRTAANTAHPARASPTISQKSHRDRIAHEIHRGFRAAADKEDIWIRPSLLKAVRSLYAKATVREHDTGAMPNILHFVAWQETPRLNWTDQIQQSHARINHG